MNYEELMAMLEGVEFEQREGFVSGMNNLNAGATARIQELEGANATLAADLQRMQAENYKLLTAQTGKLASNADEGGKEEITDEDKDVYKLIKE